MVSRPGGVRQSHVLTAREHLQTLSFSTTRMMLILNVASQATRPHSKTPLRDFCLEQIDALFGQLPDSCPTLGTWP